MINLHKNSVKLKHQLVFLATVFISSRNAPRGGALRDETETAAGETTS